ncbi:MAG: alginate lyase family protein [Tateyamaria sp.]|uniref:alginate lyase family protein n=1 Tax=Tateyamaria sp. TaxID=1929288 RepID=UPI00329D191A
MRPWIAALAFCTPLPAIAACDVVPDPVISLSFDSRYAADDPSRSEIDIEAETAAKEALADLDDFITYLTTRTDAAVGAGDRDAANCVMAALATWARADALSDLGSQTAQLTIGSRLAALALVAAQVAPAAPVGDTSVVSAWLGRRMDSQMTFWETASDGAASGNLRAWAALAGAATSLLTQDPVTLGWAGWSLGYVACTASQDGSLPQEMQRKQLALHYQVHAVTPMVVAAALLEQQGVPVMNRCGRALDRIVDFTLKDLAAGGVASAAYAGAPQTLDAGVEGLKDFQLAWAESWLSLRANPELEALVAPRRPLRYSKLGGNQTRLWNAR